MALGNVCLPSHDSQSTRRLSELLLVTFPSIKLVTPQTRKNVSCKCFHFAFSLLFPECSRTQFPSHLTSPFPSLSSFLAQTLPPSPIQGFRHFLMENSVYWLCSVILALCLSLLVMVRILQAVLIGPTVHSRPNVSLLLRTHPSSRNKECKHACFSSSLQWAQNPGQARRTLSKLNMNGSAGIPKINQFYPECFRHSHTST